MEIKDREERRETARKKTDNNKEDRQQRRETTRKKTDSK
jgi:hypothetical protein